MYELKRGDMDLKQVVSGSLYRKEWNTIEDEKTQPCFLREIISTPYKEFSERVLEQDPGFVREIVRSLYSGDAYILKQGFPGKFLRDLSVRLHQHGKQTPSSFIRC